jgi:hypothetical protein
MGCPHDETPNQITYVSGDSGGNLTVSIGCLCGKRTLGAIPPKLFVGSGK